MVKVLLYERTMTDDNCLLYEVKDAVDGAIGGAFGNVL